MLEQTFYGRGKKLSKQKKQQIIKKTFYIGQKKGKIKSTIVKEIQKLFEESEKKKKMKD